MLYDPVPVFQRVRDERKFWAPFVVVAVIITAVSWCMMPFVRAANAAAIAANAPGSSIAGSPLSVIFAPLTLVVALLLGSAILWVLVSVVGGEAKFGTLVCLELYFTVPVVLNQIVVLIMLLIGGVGKVKTIADLKPALGLDALVPNAGPVLTAALGYITPFNIWNLVLLAVGVHVAQKTSKNGGIAVAIISGLIGIGFAIGAAFLGKR
ncbi:MAG TPA: YIP1 family protein [Gemmatimonadales bacterium]|nr:YIP1 family protein [Gemmatimonadales bacterium]